MKPNAAQLSLKDLKQRLDLHKARRSYLHYLYRVSAGTFEINWHHVAVAREIDNWLNAKEPYHLILCMPPRHGKSEMGSRYLPGYVFGRNPDHHVIHGSYGAELVFGMSRDAQNIMLRPEYIEVFPNTRLVTKGTRREGGAIRRDQEFSIIGHRGHYRAAGVGGGIAGYGFHVGIIDDPTKGRQQAESHTVRETIEAWYTSDFRTRLEKGGRMLMILTRWHVHDLAAFVQQRARDNPDADQWRVISFPAIAEDHPQRHWMDRRENGEALWPNRFPRKDLLKFKALDEYDWCSLFQQRPSQPGGERVKREWLTVIHPSKAPIYLEWVRYWDLAVTAKTSADFTASGQMALDTDGNIYVRHFIHMQDEWPTVRAVLKANLLRERCLTGIEAQGTQKGFVQDLQADGELMRQDVACLVQPFDATKDKLTRALPWIHRAAGKRFFILDGEGVESYVNELVQFTGHNDPRDDQIDWTSGAFRMLVGEEPLETEVLQIPDWLRQDLEG